MIAFFFLKCQKTLSNKSGQAEHSCQAEKKTFFHPPTWEKTVFSSSQMKKPFSHPFSSWNLLTENDSKCNCTLPSSLFRPNDLPHFAPATWASKRPYLQLPKEPATAKASTSSDSAASSTPFSKIPPLSWNLQKKWIVKIQEVSFTLQTASTCNASIFHLFWETLNAKWTI